MTTAEVELLALAKQSITDDPNFTMDSYCHCLANHICRAAGDSVEGEYLAGGATIHVRYRVLELVPSLEKTYIFQRGSLRNNKAELFAIIDQFIAEKYVPEPELVGA